MQNRSFSKSQESGSAVGCACRPPQFNPCLSPYRRQGAANMARSPQKKRPKKIARGEHLILHRPGPYILPDLIRCEGVERDRGTNVLLIRAYTYEDRLFYLPLEIPAAASLAAAPPKVVRFEILSPGTQVAPPEVSKPLEIPVLDRFVCFRAISAEWRMPEFLTKKNQRVLIPFSSAAHKQLVDHLKAVPAVR